MIRESLYGPPTHTVDRSKLEEAADYADVEIRDAYSGRYMYGATCIGVVYGHIGAFVRFARKLTQLDERAEEWIDDPCMDNMARDMIAYWPRVMIWEDEG